MSELKPCPFCGGTKIRTIEGRAYCVDCGLNVAFALIGKWNTRPIEDKLQAEIDRLKIEVEELKSEIRKWEKFDPQDDDLMEARKQSEGKNKDFKETLCGNSIYIIALEQKVRKLQAEIARLRAERRWIPVSQPPKRNGKYVTLKRATLGGFFLDTEIYEKGKFYSDDYNPVVYYLPLLPPPPEDE